MVVPDWTLKAVYVLQPTNQIISRYRSKYTCPALPLMLPPVPAPLGGVRA